MLEEEELHAKEEENSRRRMEEVRSAVASDELELAEVKQRLQKSDAKCAALMATRRGERPAFFLYNWTDMQHPLHMTFVFHQVSCNM